ncbi:GSCFA domain-containing protein, partial [Aquimarina celericrescens]|nr:GSCFA domain-containing protein [Aquimarina celericrescens]
EYKKLSYFPSYEIMMDELRDYRFYDMDMIHPSKLAIEYIWEHFVKIWISEETIKTMGRVEEVNKGLRHRPFNTKSLEYASFLEKLKIKKNQINIEYPHMVWED